MINFLKNLTKNKSFNNYIFQYNYYIKYFSMISLFSFFLWILYLEINPKLRNIWLRIDSQSNLIFAPINILNLIIYSIKKIDFWLPWNWDMNPFIWIFFGNITYFTIKLYIK